MLLLRFVLFLAALKTENFFTCNPTLIREQIEVLCER